jgi:hypothetical protein
MEHTDAYVVGGLKIDIFRCLLCGDMTELRKPRPDRRPVAPSVAPAKKNKHHERSATCTVVGCDDKYAPRYSKYRMCMAHSKIMSQYNCGKIKVAPFIKTGDAWIENPDRQKGQKS